MDCQYDTHTGGVYALISYSRRYEAAEEDTDMNEDRTQTATATTAEQRHGQQRPPHPQIPPAAAGPTPLLRRLLPARDEVSAPFPLLPAGRLLSPAPAGCFFKSKASGGRVGPIHFHTNHPPIGEISVRPDLLYYVQEGALLSAEPFEAVWEIGPKLGSGAFATVHKCIEKVS